uniref:Uncharacterized protein n=1 Tax=Brassica oleracea TaxID=3712 RepID=A0A3P6CTN6_BRAOL|nr:unnamed protein product [Brassica oleracea]
MDIPELPVGYTHRGKSEKPTIAFRIIRITRQVASCS